MNTLISDLTDPETAMEMPIQDSDIMSIRLGVVGRSRAGKSVKFLMLFRDLLRQRISNGYYFGMRSPLETNERIQSLERMLKELRTPQGALSTVDPTEFDFFLFRGNKPLVRFAFREVIGQVLTTTTRRSPPDQINLYNEYVRELGRSDVLWLDIPCHANPATPEKVRQFDVDRNLVCDYLRIATTARRDNQPMSVMVVPTKVDTRFDRRDDVFRLSHRKLKQTFHLPVSFIEGCDLVQAASIVPVSSLGFGTTELASHEGQASHVLRQGMQPAPFNLFPLLLLSLVYGMALKNLKAGLDSDELTRLMTTLSKDFDRHGGWHCALKG